MSSEVKKLMDMARQVMNQANHDYEQAVSAADIELSKAKTKSSTLLEAAQSICDHSYTTTAHWTEDGAFPNEPRSRVDCAICNKKGVM